MHFRVSGKDRNYEENRKLPNSQFNNSNSFIPFSLSPLMRLSKAVIVFCMQHTLLNNHFTDFYAPYFLGSNDFRLLQVYPFVLWLDIASFSWLLTNNSS